MATTLSIDQGEGSVTGMISKSVSPTSTLTYTLTATNSYGVTTLPVTVTVTSTGSYFYATTTDGKFTARDTAHIFFLRDSAIYKWTGEGSATLWSNMAGLSSYGLLQVSSTHVYAATITTESGTPGVWRLAITENDPDAAWTNLLTEDDILTLCGAATGGVNFVGFYYFLVSADGTITMKINIGGEVSADYLIHGKVGSFSVIDGAGTYPLKWAGKLQSIPGWFTQDDKKFRYYNPTLSELSLPTDKEWLVTSETTALTDGTDWYFFALLAETWASNAWKYSGSTWTDISSLIPSLDDMFKYGTILASGDLLIPNISSVQKLSGGVISDVLVYADGWQYLGNPIVREQIIYFYVGNIQWISEMDAENIFCVYMVGG